MSKQTVVGTVLVYTLYSQGSDLILFFKGSTQHQYFYYGDVENSEHLFL